MKVTVIYGSNNINNTYDHTNFLLEVLHKSTSIDLDEFFLPKEFPLACRDYCDCFTNNFYSYFNYCDVNQIAKSISDSDLIILACSNAEWKEFPQSMKLLLDHLSYLWMPHKAHIPMYQKIGLVISDDNSLILPSTTRTLKKHLKFWGIKNILNYNFALYSEDPVNTSIDSRSKKCLQLVFLSEKILNIFSSSHHILDLNDKKVVNFPYSKLMKNRPVYHSDKCINNVIELKNIQNNV